MHDPHEWLTRRAAAQQLHEDLGIHRETARRLLAAGALGRPRNTSLASFHRRDDVDAFGGAALRVWALHARAPWERAPRTR